MRPPSAMPWPSSAVNSGPRRLSPPPRITETYRNSQPTCSTAFWPSPADRLDVQSQDQERNKVRAAYHRAEYLDERRAMMQRWADYVDALSGGGGERNGT